jgi:hypothetical protein
MYYIVADYTYVIFKGSKEECAQFLDRLWKHMCRKYTTSDAEEDHDNAIDTMSSYVENTTFQDYGTGISYDMTDEEAVSKFPEYLQLMPDILKPIPGTLGHAIAHSA